MVINCQECGKKVEEKFQFCPFCGKKLIKPKICSNCGNKLKENFLFCPECGKKWDSSKKSIVSVPKIVKTKEEKKPVEEKIPEEKPKPKIRTVSTKPTKQKNVLDKIKMPGEKVLIILFVVIIIIVAAAAVIVINPFGSGDEESSVGGSFSVTVENSYDDDVEYYFIVDGINSYGNPDSPYEIGSGDSPVTYNINSGDLIIKRNTHEIKFHASLDGISWIGYSSADSVSESATFKIVDDDGSLGVNCTESQ